VVLDIMEKVKSGAMEINKAEEDFRERLYYLTFNATVIIFRICHKLREIGFAK